MTAKAIYVILISGSNILPEILNERRRLPIKNFCKILLSLIFATMFCLVLPSCSGRAVIERSKVGELWNDMVYGGKTVTAVYYSISNYEANVCRGDAEKIAEITNCLKELEKHIVKEADESITDSLSSYSSTLLSFPSKSHALSIEFYDGYVVIGAYASIEEYITDENKTTTSLNGDTICFSLDNKAEETINNLMEITGRN